MELVASAGPSSVSALRLDAHPPPNGSLQAAPTRSAGWARARDQALPGGQGLANLNTLAFAKLRRVRFTGQNGIYGRLDPKTGAARVWDGPRGHDPYGITTTLDRAVYYASRPAATSTRVDLDTGPPPCSSRRPRIRVRRVWSDLKHQIWISEWNAGNVSRYDPRSCRAGSAFCDLGPPEGAEPSASRMR